MKADLLVLHQTSHQRLESLKFLARCYTDTKRTQMPGQATIPAKLSITIDGETKVFHDKTKFTHCLSTNPALQKIMTEKNNTRMETTPQKKQESNPSKNLKEDSQKKKMPTLTTKIIRNNNYFSIISLNIKGLNSSTTKKKD